jgi:serine/threonine protein kinase
VRCYGYGETADYIYVVLEFLEGGGLDDILEEQSGLLSWRKVIDWIVEICDALAHLHSLEPAPIIHGDIKPSNVILGRNGRPRLTDLSLAEPYQPGRERVAMGTLGYLSPEHMFGYRDTRSDIYALGATLHHLLTRRNPRRERLFSFHDAPPRSLNPAISEALEAVILKATEHSPLDRYQSVAEMKDALLACL